MRDNKHVYSTVEFHRWVGRNELDSEERFLVSQFLSPTASTLEAGTGGGRILLALRDMGYSDLQGFDYVPGFIEEARAADPMHRIRFEVQDATCLSYADASFDQVIYLQQILSCMDGPGAGPAAVREAIRVLRPGGVALFSFLCYEVRSRSPVGRVLMGYLRLLRWALRTARSPQVTPWVRMGDRFNRGALLDRGPYIYWYRAAEAANMLENAGFIVEAVATTPQIHEGVLCGSVAQLTHQSMQGALYCVCRKPGSAGASQPPADRSTLP